MKTIRITPSRRRRGAALVEYGLIIAGVALISAAAVSVFGKKTSDMIGSAAAVLPGAQSEDNGAIRSGRLIETTNNNGVVELDTQAIQDGGSRLGDNLGVPIDTLVQDPPFGGGSGGSAPPQ